MSDLQPPAALWGDERYGGACVVLADDAPLGTAGGGEAPGGGLPSPSLPEGLAAAALAVTHERLRRGRTHPSTRLLASWIAEHISGGERVLDVGCGSGVLALVAARLGAAEALGIDIEPAAVSAAEANACRNGLAAAASCGGAPVGEAELGTFDVVFANITAGVLVPLAGDIAERVAPGGRLAISGISAGQTSSVAAAYRRHGIELAAPVRLDDWVSLSGRNASSNLS